MPGAGPAPPPGPRASRSEFSTTLTELNAIARLASSGLSCTPHTGTSTPMATGMATTL